MDATRTPFDESLLSGFLDEELTQAEAQRVRVHLENDASARALLEELRRIRTATLGTRFRLPEDRQWDERPRGAGSAMLRSLGWLALVLSVLTVVGFGLWHLATTPHAIFTRIAVFGGLGGLGLLFLSVLLDRLKELKTDRYRRVQK